LVRLPDRDSTPRAAVRAGGPQRTRGRRARLRDGTGLANRAAVRGKIRWRSGPRATRAAPIMRRATTRRAIRGRALRAITLRVPAGVAAATALRGVPVAVAGTRRVAAVVTQGAAAGAAGATVETSSFLKESISFFPWGPVLFSEDRARFFLPRQRNL